MAVDELQGRVGFGVRNALAVAAVLLFFTNLDSYAFFVGLGPRPSLLVVAFVGAAGLLLLFGLHREAPFLGSALLQWICYYFILTALWSMWVDSRPVAVQAVYDRFRSIGFLVALAILFDDASARRTGLLAVVCATAGIALLNVAEAFGIVQFLAIPNLSRVPGRAAGLFINANGAGQVIVFGVALSVGALPRKVRGMLLVVSAAGVAVTFSRGAFVLMAALIVLLLWRKVLPVWPTAAAVALIVGIAILASGPATDVLEARGVLNDENLARFRLESDDSGRKALAARALRLFLDAPLVGNGVGATGDLNASEWSHNQFLSLAADHGLLGLVAFPLLGVAIATVGVEAIPFAAVLMLAGIFSHNLLDDRATLLAIALAGTARRSHRELATKEAAAAEV